MLRDPRRRTCCGVLYERRAFGLVTRLRGLCYYSLPVAAATAVTAQDEIQSKRFSVARVNRIIREHISLQECHQKLKREQ
jgi:hypothetical protein